MYKTASSSLKQMVKKKGLKKSPKKKLKFPLQRRDGKPQKERKYECS